MISRRLLFWIILPCFFLSGASGLILEILWSRNLVLIFGSTTFAISTVLAAFMGGLALGSYIWGRIADKIKRHLWVYGLLEGFIGLYALILPFIFHGLGALYRLIWGYFSPEFYSFSLLRFIIIFIVLLIPTTFMGGTLPVLSKFFTLTRQTIGVRVGTLYGVNTFGACAGTFISGFILIPFKGETFTLYIASAVNIFIAIICNIFFSKTQLNSAQVSLEQESLDESTYDNVSIGKTRVVLLCFAISGFAAMMYEVLWTRVLSLVLGSSVYAFTTMLLTFLIGLALGGLFFSIILRWISSPIYVLSWLQTLIGFWAFLNLYIFRVVPFLFLQLFNITTASMREPISHRLDLTIEEIEKIYPKLNMIQVIICMAVMMGPTFLMGGVFPLVIRITSSLKKVGKDIGMAYSLNTIGSILGSTLAGFLFIPYLGLFYSLLAAILINVIAAVILGIFCEEKGRPGYIFNMTLIVMLFILFFSPPTKPEWNPNELSAGVFKYIETFLNKDNYQDFTLAHYLGSFQNSDHHVVFYKEGVTTTVTVLESHNNTWVKVNGKVDACTQGDMETQLLVAHLPMVMARSMDDVLVIGYGSGVTVGSVSRYPVKNYAVVELEPVIIEASRFFSHANYNPLAEAEENKAEVESNFDKYKNENPFKENPWARPGRLQVIRNDGRNYLLASEKMYDVIISEPSNPWMTGASKLFTREFFNIAKKRLKPDGIFCQWVQLYGVDNKMLRILLKTFHATFPETFVFIAIDNADLFLIGSQTKLSLNIKNIKKLLSYPSVSQDLARIDIKDIYDLFSRFVMGTEQIAGYYESDPTSPLPLNTDDYPYIEYYAPRTLYYSNSREMRQNLYYFYKEPRFYSTDFGDSKEEKVDFYLGLAKMHYKLEEWGLARELVDLAQKEMPTAEGFYLKSLIFSSEEPEKSAEFLKEALTVDPKFKDALLREAREYQSSGKHQEAVEYYKKFLELEPENYLVRLEIGISLVQLGEKDPKFLDEANNELTKIPDDKRTGTCQKTWELLAKIKAKEGNQEEANSCYERALQESSDNEDLWLKFIEFQFKSGNFSEAKSIVQRMRKVFSAKDFLNEGYTVYQQSFSKSIPFFQKAIELDEKQTAAYDYLSEAYRSRGESDKALEIYREWQKNCPGDQRAFAYFGHVARKHAYDLEEYSSTLPLPERVTCIEKAIQILQEGKTAYEQAITIINNGDKDILDITEYEGRVKVYAKELERLQKLLEQLKSGK